MKPVFYAVAVTAIDGKIAKNSAHFSDWSSKEDKDFLYKKMNEADVIVLGNNTYKIAKKKLEEKNRNCIIFTHSVDKHLKENERLLFMNPEKTDILDLVKKNSYKKICILGGAQIYSYFLKKNLLDEIFLTIEPIVFGSGISLFESIKIEKKFTLVSVKKLNDSGTILLRYKR